MTKEDCSDASEVRTAGNAGRERSGWFVPGLGRYASGLLSPMLATFLMPGIWIVGAAVINLLTDLPNKG